MIYSNSFILCFLRTRNFSVEERRYRYNTRGQLKNPITLNFVEYRRCFSIPVFLFICMYWLFFFFSSVHFKGLETLTYSVSHEHILYSCVLKIPLPTKRNLTFFEKQLIPSTGQDRFHMVLEQLVIITIRRRANKRRENNKDFSCCLILVFIHIFP
jgi:hypothetical protein